MYRVKSAKVMRRMESGAERPGKTAQKVAERVLGFGPGELQDLWGMRSGNSCFLALTLEVRGDFDDHQVIR